MRIHTLPLLLAAGLLAACGSDSPTGLNPHPDPDPDPDLNGTLECEIKGYPCSLSQVPIAVLERGDALGDQALDMLAGGASTSQAANFLQGQSDVAEVESDEFAIWFRVKGGTGIWILREGAFSPDRSSEAALAGRTTPPPQPRPNFDVVNPGSEQKRALVLSPFLWEVPELDDGAPVAAILAATRGYENRVTYLANAAMSDATVNLGSFSGWDAYDVIHLSTHGKRICTPAGCRATLVAGLLENILPPGSGTLAEKLHTLAHQGIGYAKGETSGREYLVINADFFRSTYPTGLDHALVFINSCQSFGSQATDLVDAIQGSTSVVLGWSDVVYVVDATAAATAFYESLSDRGYPAEVAHDELGALRNGPEPETVPAASLFPLGSTSTWPPWSCAAAARVLVHDGVDGPRFDDDPAPPSGPRVDFCRTSPGP